MSELPSVDVGIIGGSGLYALSAVEDATTVSLETPFGAPSDSFRVGTLGGKRVAFLSRHGRDHRLSPSEINYRANIFGFKLLGARRILSASAVGSMREQVHPRDVVLPDQFIDRTRQRPSTFFGEGLVAHISFAEPICPQVREAMASAARDRKARVHDGGVYLCMEGPAFSTRAESLLYRGWGVDVIGMTNLQEAKLAREAEICYATLALVTDYDCWHEEEQHVSVKALLDNLQANAALAADVIGQAVGTLPAQRVACACGHALDAAIITPRNAVPASTLERLRPIVGRVLS